MDSYYEEKLEKIHHWNKDLFSLVCTKNPGFKFKNGEFIMLGIKKENKIIISKAYSIVSSNYEENLEFLSIKIQNGNFTTELSKIKINENLYISKKPTGTILKENLKNDGLRLWMFSTGTGLAPFISVIKDINIWKFYKIIILINSVSYDKNLSYRFYINNIFWKNFFFLNKKCFFYYPLITKQKNKENVSNRITDLIINKELFFKINNFETFDIKVDRIMICGNIEMIKDLTNLIEKEYNFFSTKFNKIGYYITEKAFIS